MRVSSYVSDDVLRPSRDSSCIICARFVYSFGFGSSSRLVCSFLNLNIKVRVHYQAALLVLQHQHGTGDGSKEEHRGCFNLETLQNSNTVLYCSIDRRCKFTALRCDVSPRVPSSSTVNQNVLCTVLYTTFTNRLVYLWYAYYSLVIIQKS